LVQRPTQKKKKEIRYNVFFLFACSKLIIIVITTPPVFAQKNVEFIRFSKAYTHKKKRDQREFNKKKKRDQREFKKKKKKQIIRFQFLVFFSFLPHFISLAKNREKKFHQHVIVFLSFFNFLILLHLSF